LVALREYWDAHQSYSSDTLAWPHALFLRMLKPSLPGKRVLELGCGTGALSAELASTAASVTAIDFSEAMLEAARVRFAHQRNLKFVSADILELELGERFDIVCGLAMLHEIDAGDYPKLIGSLKRHMAGSSSFGWFQENSFFNPVFRLFRRHLVGRYGIPKFGSEHETPFDAERLGLLRQNFRYCQRSGEAFVLLQRVHDYVIRSRRFGPAFDGFDERVSGWPLPDGLKRNLSYFQHIYFSDSGPRLEEMGV
jgi:ubiquinone/menaquinone biosynthesis C-methylase UbiE